MGTIGSLNLNNVNAAINVQNEGSINSLKSTTSQSGTTQVVNNGALNSANITNTGGNFAMFNNGSMNNASLSNTSSAESVFVNNGSMNNLSATNKASTFSFQNNGAMNAISLDNRSNGSAYVENNSSLNKLTTNTYVAHTEISNNGSVNSLYAKDQNDDTHIFNAGGIGTANLVSNGAKGYINMYNQGTVNQLNLDANYGGIIDFSNAGSISKLWAEATGASHGQNSQINILNIMS